MKPYIVGISGGSGSGKTSLIEKIRESIAPNTITLLSQDNYYLPIEQQRKDENGQENFDLPSAIDIKKFTTDLVQLSNNQLIHKKEYTFNNNLVEGKEITVYPSEVIILEGLFIFHEPSLRKMVDFSIFVDADDQIRLERRIKRDFAERGYDKAQVKYQWKHHVEPCYEQFLKPYKSKVDLVINNNVDYLKSVKFLVSHIQSIIANKKVNDLINV